MGGLGAIMGAALAVRSGANPRACRVCMRAKRSYMSDEEYPANSRREHRVPARPEIRRKMAARTGRLRGRLSDAHCAGTAR